MTKPAEEKYFLAGVKQDFLVYEEAKQYKCVPVSIPGSAKRVNIIHFNGRLYAVLNVCPHAGSGLHNGSVVAIEDMGIIWGAEVVCHLHGWSFDLETGKCSNSRVVLDVFELIEYEDEVWVSYLPCNSGVEGPRRDFGGRELN